MTRRTHGHYSWTVSTALARFPIRLASEMTGIAEETLRVWERRYTFPRPRRTAAGARVYSSDDIERLRVVRRAIERGFRPSSVIGRAPQEIEAMLSETSAKAPRTELGGAAPSQGTLLDAVAREDATSLAGQLRGACVLLGARRFVVELAHPVTVAVGERWAAGTLDVRHEHLWSAALTLQLNVLRSSFEPRPSAPVLLLTTLPGLRHALGLELVAAYAAAQGAAVRVLGAETPPSQIVEAARGHQARVVALGLTPPFDAARVEGDLTSLRKALGGRRGAELWLGGGGAAAFSRMAGVRCIDTWAALDEALERIS